MKRATKDVIEIILSAVILCFAIGIAVNAWAGDEFPPGHGPKKVNNITHNNVANADSDSHAWSSSDASADNQVNVGGDSVENNSSNVVLVPNNNTESCVRVFGLAFGKNGESGALGVPWRSKSCDFEQAADDAFAAGERDLGWFWKCQNKNLYGTFKRKGMTSAEAKAACFDATAGTIRSEKIISDLQREVERLRNEGHRERLICDESKDRIVEACNK